MKLKYLKWIHLLSFSVEIFKYRFSLRKLYFVNCEDYFISKHTSITKTIISIMLEKYSIVRWEILILFSIGDHG